MGKMEKLKKAEKIIGDIYRNTDVTDPMLLRSDPLHSKTARDWVLKLKPSADIALQIAALGHDIDRAFAKRAIKQSDYPEDQYDQYKNDHAINSANILAEHLAEAGFNSDIIKRIIYLVEHHEVGGDPDAEILKEADSLTFFSVSIPFYFEDRGAAKTKKKIVFMYKRLSDKAKALVKQVEFEDPKISALFNEAIADIDT